MIRIVVFIEVPLEKRDDMTRLLDEICAKSQKEQGNYYYQYYLHPSEQDKLIIIEKWENAQSLEAHEASEHFKRIIPQMLELATVLDIQKQEDPA